MWVKILQLKSVNQFGYDIYYHGAGSLEGGRALCGTGSWAQSSLANEWSINFSHRHA